MHPLPTTESEADAFLHAFESCTLPKDRWTHAAHLFTGACYVHQLGETAALDRMRLCVRRYNESVGGQNTATSGYHETITVFWIKLLHSLHTQSTATRIAFARQAVARFAIDREILRRYYDFDVPASTEARRISIAPTLAPIEATVPQ